MSKIVEKVYNGIRWYALVITIGEIIGALNLKKRADMVASKIKIKKACEWCGQEYYALKVNTRFCCKKCNDQAYKAKMRKTFLDDAEREFKDKTIREPLRKLNEKIYLDVVAGTNLQLILYPNGLSGKEMIETATFYCFIFIF